MRQKQLRPSRHNGTFFCCTIIRYDAKQHTNVVVKVNSCDLAKQTESAYHELQSTRYGLRPPDIQQH